jgi:hypothetical protein
VQVFRTLPWLLLAVVAIDAIAAHWGRVVCRCRPNYVPPGLIGVPCFGGVGWMVVVGWSGGGQESGYGVSGDRYFFGGCGMSGRCVSAVERPSLEK